MTKKKRLGLILGISIPCGFILTIALCFGVFFWLFSRPFTYEGEYKDLYTTAVCNIFGIQGYISDGEALYDPIITIEETDEYGRVMFLYQEKSSISKMTDLDWYGGLVIMQKSDESKSYYLDNCYLPLYVPTTEYKTVFTEEEIITFKNLNNWNKELDSTDLLCSDFAVRHPKGALDLKDSDFKQPLNEYVSSVADKVEYNVYRWSEYSQTDKNGLELYYAKGINRDEEPTKDYHFAMIFNADKTCPQNNVIEIKNIENTEQYLTELKQRVGWDR